MQVISVGKYFKCQEIFLSRQMTNGLSFHGKEISCTFVQQTNFWLGQISLPINQVFSCINNLHSLFRASWSCRGVWSTSTLLPTIPTISTTSSTSSSSSSGGRFGVSSLIVVLLFSSTSLHHRARHPGPPPYLKRKDECTTSEK